MPRPSGRTTLHSGKTAICHSMLPRHKHGRIATAKGEEQTTNGLLTTCWRTTPRGDKREDCQHHHNRAPKEQFYFHGCNKHRLGGTGRPTTNAGALSNICRRYIFLIPGVFASSAQLVAWASYFNHKFVAVAAPLCYTATLQISSFLLYVARI